MVQRKWEITEECVREMAATAPEGFPDYKSNQELWKELCNRLWEGGLPEPVLGRLPPGTRSLRLVVNGCEPMSARCRLTTI